MCSNVDTIIDGETFNATKFKRQRRRWRKKAE